MMAYRLTGTLQLPYTQAPYSLRPQAQMLSIFDEILHYLVDMTPSRPITPLDATDTTLVSVLFLVVVTAVRIAQATGDVFP